MLHRQVENSVVKTRGAMDNVFMNFFLALLWLIAAVVLLAYEHYLGETRFRFRVGDSTFSVAWLMLLLTLYNLARWWSSRAYRAERRAEKIRRENQEWRRRFPESAGPPDPNLNFTDAPPAAPDRGITDQPPSNN
jgi:hypothetical protein